MTGNTVGHYRIVARIGAGGMGEVFLAEDTRLGRKAAIKFLPAELAGNQERRQRFLTEAKAASALNHPHVCTVYDVGETAEGIPFIAMEFVDGDSLDKLLSRNGTKPARCSSSNWRRNLPTPAWHTPSLISCCKAARQSGPSCSRLR